MIFVILVRRRTINDKVSNIHIMCITSFSFSGVTVQRLFVAASAGVAPAAAGDAFVVTAAHVGIASLASPVELRVSVTAVHPPSRATEGRTEAVSVKADTLEALCRENSINWVCESFAKCALFYASR